MHAGTGKDAVAILSVETLCDLSSQDCLDSGYMLSW